jgi:hypothetical protein
MSDPEPSLHDALTDLTHALQLARPLVRALRIDLTEQARTAIHVEAAIDRAVDALLQARAGGARA